MKPDKPEAPIYRTVDTLPPIEGDDAAIAIWARFAMLRAEFLAQLPRLAALPRPEDPWRQEKLKKLKASVRSLQRRLDKGGDADLACVAFLAGQQAAEFEADRLRRLVRVGERQVQAWESRTSPIYPALQVYAAGLLAAGIKPHNLASECEKYPKAFPDGGALSTKQIRTYLRKVGILTLK